MQKKTTNDVVETSRARVTQAKSDNEELERLLNESRKLTADIMRQSAEKKSELKKEVSSRTPN